MSWNLGYFDFTGNVPVTSQSSLWKHEYDCGHTYVPTSFCGTNLFEPLLSVPITVGRMDPFHLFLPLKTTPCSFSVVAVVNVCQEITNSGGHIAIDGLLLGSQNPLGCGPSLSVMTECHEVAKIILLRLQAMIVIVWVLIQMADTDKDISVLLVPQLAEP